MTRGADSKPLKPKVKNLVGRTQNREAPERGWLRRKSADSASECLVSSKSGERGGRGGGERESVEMEVLSRAKARHGDGRGRAENIHNLPSQLNSASAHH